MTEKAVTITAFFESIARDCEPEEISLELAELCRSAGLVVMKNVIARQKKPNAALLIGSGKAEELRLLCRDLGTTALVFDQNLSPTQQRNLEEAVGQKVIDRTQLILDIFAQRAHSSEGKLQVELAQLRYLLPRLAGKGVLLSRLGGGVGTRGPGEQKLETDRRRIRARIARFSNQLEALGRRRLSGVQQKKEKGFPIIALVGYTHAGKSTLFNALTRSDVPVRHKLFSTLDTTTRILKMDGGKEALLVDTVGFVRDLPHHLIESFKATLEEVRHADLLLHVVDGAEKNAEAHFYCVEGILKEMGVQSSILKVYNKIDLTNSTEISGDLQGLGISAKFGLGLDHLKRTIANRLP